MKYQTYYAKTYEMPNSPWLPLLLRWRSMEGMDEGQKTTYISDQCVYAALDYVNGRPTTSTSDYYVERIRDLERSDRRLNRRNDCGTIELEPCLSPYTFWLMNWTWIKCMLIWSQKPYRKTTGWKFAEIFLVALKITLIFFYKPGCMSMTKKINARAKNDILRTHRM